MSCLDTSDTVTVSEQMVLTYGVCISRVPQICIQDTFLSQCGKCMTEKLLILFRK
jgi:hypothetical protein